jgi:hypothetical protein
MSLQAALPGIQTLSDRNDQLTGEVLSDRNPLNQPGIIRALFAGAQALALITESRIQRAIGLTPLSFIAPSD